MRILMIACLFLAGCQGKEECKSWSAGGLSAGWSSCGDKSERELQCEPIEKDKPAMKCTCAVDKVVGKTFETTGAPPLGTLETSTKLANDQCGWHLSR